MNKNFVRDVLMFESWLVAGARQTVKELESAISKFGTLPESLNFKHKVICELSDMGYNPTEIRKITGYSYPSIYPVVRKHKKKL